MKQGSLLDWLDAPPPGAVTVPKPTKFHASTWVTKTPCVEPFNDWDFARMIPDPMYRAPAELALPTDDPDWQPGAG